MTTSETISGDSRHFSLPVGNRPVLKPDLQQTIDVPQLQWPSLADHFDAAANLAMADRLYCLQGEAAAFSLFVSWPELSLTHDRPVSQLISPTATGLGCTCPIWTLRSATGPGDGRYFPDILALLLQIYLGRRIQPLPAGSP